MKIESSEFLVVDLDNTEKFYSEKLGFIVVEKNAQFISFQAGSSLLRFKKTEKLNPVYHFAFNIPNNLLDEALEWISERAKLIAANENSPIVDFKNWNAKSIYFFDNNGNILELIARFDLENESKTKFSSMSVLEISEVAVVTDHIHDEIQRLSEKGIKQFSKQPVLENFAASGDDNGLIILSVEGRHWYPTQIPVEKFPVTVTVNTGGKRVVLKY